MKHHKCFNCGAQLLDTEGVQLRVGQQVRLYDVNPDTGEKRGRGDGEIRLDTDDYEPRLWVSLGGHGVYVAVGAFSLVVIENDPDTDERERRVIENLHGEEYL